MPQPDSELHKRSILLAMSGCPTQYGGRVISIVHCFFNAPHAQRFANFSALRVVEQNIMAPGRRQGDILNER
jgi:hypothetical protein